jgi:hypothetical protein
LMLSLKFLPESCRTSSDARYWCHHKAADCSWFRLGSIYGKKRRERMQNDLIGELQALTGSLWARAGLGECVQIPRQRQDDGSAHVEVIEDDRCDIVVTERGGELQRMAGLSLCLSTIFQRIGITDGF